MAPTIGIIGSYGGLNVGDEAILASAVRQLRDACPAVEIVVFSRNAAHTLLHHRVERAVNVRTALREEVVPEIARLDMLLLGGGGILYDREARAYLGEVEIARELGIPTFAFAVGIGPLEDHHERIAVRDGLNRMSGITVREITAKRLCEAIGVKVPVEVTADPALLLEPRPFTDEMLAEEGIPPRRTLVGFSVRERGGAAPLLENSPYHDLIADVADYCVTRFDAEAVFVPMERADHSEIYQVIARMERSDRAHLLRRETDPQALMGLVDRFALAVGLRLHFLIFAAVTGTPFAALPYASKVQDLVASLGIAEQMATDVARTGTFLATLDRLWDEREQQRRQLVERVPELQRRARRTVPLALATLGLGPEAARDGHGRAQSSGESRADPEPVA